ncbi:MAG: hypothetical protein RPU42_04165 [Candidatus Sedimenticola sp. (ex Thyasira tokunagai)]
MKIILFFILLTVTVSVSAAVTVYSTNRLPSEFYATAQLACDRAAEDLSLSPSYDVYGYLINSYTCGMRRISDDWQYLTYNVGPFTKCETGEEWSDVNQSCFVPVTCNPGDEISVTTDGSMGLNFCFSGCAYDFSGVGVYTGGSWSGKLVSTGQTCSESDSAPPGDFGPVQDDHCVTNGGVTVCDGVPGDACSVVNGIEVCIDQQSPDDCGYVNGESLCADAPKNCGVFNGEVVCAEAPDLMHSESSPDGYGCMRDFNGKSLCMTHEGMQYEVSETVTNADGSKTTTTTTTDNIKGHGVKTTTETISADGTSTERTTTNSGADPTGGEGEEEKEKEPEFSLGDKGSFDEGGLDTEIAAAKARFGTMISTIQSEAGTLFSFSSGSAGELPCWSVTIRETSYQMCLSDYSAQFSVIASGLLFISYLIGLAILFR